MICNSPHARAYDHANVNAHDGYDVRDVHVFHYVYDHDVHVHENDCTELFNLNVKLS